ncbi:hypothetical protein [Corynebacterium sp. S5S1]|uniref:hypothetical protein n=1 Tax=Corynebacterium sp. S5S1 TaxID=1881620 RepID=UPI000B1F728F|nr:hypothetical protein [Corynebacterium sp. S5S1]
MNTQDPSIVLAITDPTLRTEASHIAAATGHRVVTASDERDIYRLGARAEALFLDSEHAELLSTTSGGPPRLTSPAYLVCLDPGPVDEQLVQACAAHAGFVIPAQNKEILAALGAHAQQGLHHSAQQGGDRQIPQRPRSQNPTRPVRPASPAYSTSPSRQLSSRTDPHLTIAVIAAGGGTGASTVAAAISRVAAHNNAGAVTLIDAVDYSGGLDLLLGIEKHDGLRWPDLNLGEGHINASDLRGNQEEIESVLSALHNEPGLSVVDANPFQIPRSIDAAVVVCPAELRCAARAAHISTQLFARHIPHSVVVRHRQWSALSIEEIEDLVRSDVIAEIGTIKRLTKITESGGLPARIPKPLSIAAYAVLAEYGWNTAAAR